MGPIVKEKYETASMSRLLEKVSPTSNKWGATKIEPLNMSDTTASCNAGKASRKVGQHDEIGEPNVLPPLRQHRRPRQTHLRPRHQDDRRDANRLGELAGTGRLDPEESMALQRSLVRIWEQLYSGTTYAVREYVDYHDEFLAAGGDPEDLDNHYSDGREVLTQDRIEPPQNAYPYSPFTLGDGAVNEHPRGTISYIAAPPTARDEAGR